MTTPATQVYAIVQAGTVVNIVVATADFITTVTGAVRIDDVTPRPGVGWTYANKKWTAPAPEPQRVQAQFQVTLEGLLPN